MNEIFMSARNEIFGIRQGASDIVNRMVDVTNSSQENYKNMSSLENILESFKTLDLVHSTITQMDQKNQSISLNAEEFINQNNMNFEQTNANKEELDELDALLEDVQDY